MNTEISKRFIKVVYSEKKTSMPKEQWFLASIPEEHHSIRHHFMYYTDDLDCAKAKEYLNNIRRYRTDSITFTPVVGPVDGAQYDRSTIAGYGKKHGIPYRGGMLPVFYVSFHWYPQLHRMVAFINGEQGRYLTDSMKNSIKGWFVAHLEDACTEELLVFLKEDAITQYKERVLGRIRDLTRSIDKFVVDFKTL